MTGSSSVGVQPAATTAEDFDNATVEADVAPVEGAFNTSRMFNG
jgi:hypothetical protein